MANVIILIHGLGNKPSKTILENWWKKAMLEGLKKNGYKKILPKIEMVYWADILYKNPLDLSITDLEDPLYLDEKYTKGSSDFKTENHDTRTKIIDFLNKQINKIFLNDDYTLNYKYITDKIISNYFRDLEVYYQEKCTDERLYECHAKELIRKRLLETLEKYKNDEIMLIGHSMGSIIAYDTICFLAKHININTFITMGSPLGLPIVINRISSEQKKYKTEETKIRTPDNITKNWFNFSDVMDKVAFNFRLDDDFLENKIGIKPTDYMVVNNYVTNGESNPHKSYGYLRAKEFSKVLSEFISTEKITFKETIKQKTQVILKNIKNNIPWIEAN